MVVLLITLSPRYNNFGVWFQPVYGLQLLPSLPQSMEILQMKLLYHLLGSFMSNLWSQRETQ